MTLNSDRNNKYTASRMTAMRDIFIAAAKIKKSSAYKFTRLDEPNNYAAGRGQYLRRLMAKPAFIPLGGIFP